MGHRPLALLLALALSGCAAYPRPYFGRRSGLVEVKEGEPVKVRAELVRECATMAGESETTKSVKEATPDAQGRWSLRLWGVVWTWRNFLTDAGCSGRVQMFVCRPYCKPVDDIDLEVLGK